VKKLWLLIFGFCILFVSMDVVYAAKTNMYLPWTVPNSTVYGMSTEGLVKIFSEEIAQLSHIKISSKVIVDREYYELGKDGAGQVITAATILVFLNETSSRTVIVPFGDDVYTQVLFATISFDDEQFIDDRDGRKFFVVDTRDNLTPEELDNFMVTSCIDNYTKYAIECGSSSRRNSDEHETMNEALDSLFRAVASRIYSGS